MTEASPGHHDDAATASVGQRFPDVASCSNEVEAKIVDPKPEQNGATGERGELCTRGYHVMKGYYEQRGRHPRGDRREGWLHTGDEASVDGTAASRIHGRIKDLIIRGGENIAPKEIEIAFREHRRRGCVRLRRPE